VSPKRAEAGRDRSGGRGRRLLAPLAAILAASVAPGWTIAGAAERPGVQVFENEPPSVDQLRGILVPESRSRGFGRKIEVPTRDSPEVPSPAQPAAASSVAFRINFELNSAVVPPAYLPFVDRVGELLRQEPRVKLLIEGHTDATGSDGYNLRLSRLRAMAVAEYLVKRRDIDPERLRVAGKGRSEPLTDDPYDPRNRRVQFVRTE